MASPTTALLKVRNEVLKTLCRHCGVSPTGRKADLVASLLESPIRPLGAKPFRIVSIDMGIRNFSYCRLLRAGTAPPVVEEWLKFDVEAHHLRDEPASTPLAYPEITYRIITETIFNKAFSPPDLVLIERQRLRSGSSKNVLEHVLRVVTLETMLHASLYTIKQLDPARAATVVDPSSPAEMVRYWCSGEKLSDLKSKLIRVGLVYDWMNALGGGAPTPVELAPGCPLQMTSTDPSLQRLRNKSRKLFRMLMGGPAAAGEKGDDLADSLLHGLAFYQWQENRQQLRQVLAAGANIEESAQRMVDRHQALCLRTGSD